MTSENWQQIEEIFHQALRCEPAQREAFVPEALPMTAETFGDSGNFWR